MWTDIALERYRQDPTEANLDALKDAENQLDEISEAQRDADSRELE